MENNTQKPMTLEALGEMMVSMQADIRELKTDMQRVNKNAFTASEKEQLLDMAAHYDESLLHEATGHKRITLTRKEYDQVQARVGFRHRFKDA